MTGPQARTPATPAAGRVLKLQSSAGNAVTAAALQRVHPAFEEHNFWAPTRPTLTDDDEFDWSQPAPRTPAGTLARLEQSFPKSIASLLLLTDASGQDALDREPMTRGFLDGVGTVAQAQEILSAHPADNASLTAAYDERTADNRAAVAQYLRDGGTQERAAAIMNREHLTDVWAALDKDLVALMDDDLVALMREETQAVLTRLDALDQVRAVMQSRASARGAGWLTVRNDLIDAKSALRVGKPASRMAWRTKFETATEWCSVREAALAPIPQEVREVTGRELREIYPILAKVDALLFGDVEFDVASFDRKWDKWSEMVPVKRLSLKSPAELHSDLKAEIGKLWPTVDPREAGQLATLLLSRGKAKLLTVLRNGGVRLATWSALNASLQGTEVFEAVEELRTEEKLRALIHRLRLTTHSAAHLTRITMAEDLAEVNRGRWFPYMGSGVPTIETELSITWKRPLWMPSRFKHWGEVHIHYSGDVADQSQITYVHIKTDRAIAGGTPINKAHPLIAQAYTDGKLSAEWKL
ncbi:hypothetical protein [Ruania zhangjianzhongii]|uniref:hypothetical protein n=1 Tax=Ruania zhangjianzhongii TaxID=2603206 RepID=UPI0011C79E3F|nr:hypothetical protein [Ruania zhangjianzhongii]